MKVSEAGGETSTGYCYSGTSVHSREEERRAGSTAAPAPQAGQLQHLKCSCQPLPPVPDFLAGFAAGDKYVLASSRFAQTWSPAGVVHPRRTRHSFPCLFCVVCLCPQKELCPVCLFPFSAGLATSEKAQMNDELNTLFSARLGWVGTRAFCRKHSSFCYILLVNSLAALSPFSQHSCCYSIAVVCLDCFPIPSLLQMTVR